MVKETIIGLKTFVGECIEKGEEIPKTIKYFMESAVKIFDRPNL